MIELAEIWRRLAAQSEALDERNQLSAKLDVNGSTRIRGLAGTLPPL